MIPMTLAEALDNHTPADALEGDHLRILRAFVAAHADPFDRNILEAHCTGSAFVLSADGEALALVYHRKLACWLNPGGHGEPGETAGEQVALREAGEETGIQGLELHPAASCPFDVDVHRIPAFGEIPAHDHLDLRYLLVAPPGAALKPSPSETEGARWFSWLELEDMATDRPTRRVLGKIRALLGRPLA